MALPPNHLRRAFTIIELLVVVVIIVALIGILIPAMGAVRNRANRAATTATLSSISSGLTQYYADFNMYPASNALKPPSQGGTSVYLGANAISSGHGEMMLAEGLLGFLPGIYDGAGADLGDSSDFGFRVKKPNLAMGGANGQVYGPYAPTTPKAYDANLRCFIDAWGHPIAYYRSSRSGPLDPTLPAVKFVFGNNLKVNDFYFNSDDCFAAFIPLTGSYPTPLTPLPPPNFFALLGATGNPTIGPINGSSNYLLVSAGPDEKYFTGDDVIMTK